MSAFRKQIDSMLSESDRSLVEVYLDIQQEAEQHYGKDTVVLIEIGSFFEVYGIDNETGTIGKPKEIAELLNLQLTRLNKSIAENSVSNPLLAGFPVVSFERYMNRIAGEEKYTVLLIRQRGNPPKVERYLDCVVSPGVNMEYTLDHESNYLTALTVERSGTQTAIGYAAIDVTTGRTRIAEMYSTVEDPSYALDEAVRLLQAYRSKEYVVAPIGREAKEDIEGVLQYFNLQEETVHARMNQPSIAYQNELLGQVYNFESALSPLEMLDIEKRPLAAEALTHALECIVEHDESIVQHLERPQHVQPDKYMYLGNNPIQQLNIASRDPHEQTVHRLIDYTKTSVGKRLLEDRLLNPITSKTELERRYDLAEALEPLYGQLTQELQNVYDLERISRRIALGRLHPFELNFLYSTLKAADRMIMLIQEHGAALLPEFVGEQEGVSQLLSTLEHTFDFDATTKVAQHQIARSLFQNGFHTQLDKHVHARGEQYAQLETIRQEILGLLHTATDKQDDNFVHIKQLEKEGFYIHMTKSRWALVQDQFTKHMVSLGKTVHAFSDFRVKVQTSNVKITADIIDEISDNIAALDAKIAGLTTELFFEQLSAMHGEFHDILQRITASIARIDVALSTAHAASVLRLTRPTILETPETGERVLEINSVRHPLVEAREENGIYVPNDITFGNAALMSPDTADSILRSQVEDDVNGLLLYGINASGKSSLMKSIGVAILLAQSGFFVPAAAMRFTIVQELFTRIVARDDFERGLSSFGVEMMELKNIFNRCSPHSVVLGDEISHGTETISAIAIVSAAILRLCEQKALFVFATHLHQLAAIDELQDRSDIALAHLAISYDAGNDALVYKRVLQEGSGSSIYGLEFAQSLHMDEAFLQRAMTIRKRIANDFSDIELLTQQNTSTYNSDVHLTTCAICKEHVEDVHHIAPQASADEDGNIEHIHKDHKYNLVPLCKECHNKAHAGKLTIHGFEMTTKGPQLQYDEA